MFAAVGLLLLIVAYGAFVIIALNQAYSDDGASGPLLGLSHGCWACPGSWDVWRSARPAVR